jgi:uncharacterized protein
MGNSIRNTVLSILELFLLLILPLPFLHLNIWYVILALLLTFLSKYLRKESWSFYGFNAIKQKEFFLAVIIGIIFGFADNFVTEPLITKMTGAEPDLSSYEGVKGSISGLIGMLAIGWIVGGLFEEYFFRGYLFYRFKTLIYNTHLYKWFTIAVTSIVFGFAHNYQGTGGIIGTLIFAIVMGLLYFYFKRNVWYLILIHGFYDTVGIFRLYLGQ